MTGLDQPRNCNLAGKVGTAPFAEKKLSCLNGNKTKNIKIWLMTLEPRVETELSAGLGICFGSVGFVSKPYWVLVSEPGFFKVLDHFPGNLILLPEMKPGNNVVY